ncbi:MAG: YdaU family protein [Pseudomonadota bacterium]
MANAYMPLYTGDYLRKTRSLKGPEHGAYILILMALWDEGGEMIYDENELREIARTHGNSWKKVWGKIQKFFNIADGKIRHSKIDEVLSETEKRKKSYQKRGKKGGKKKAENANKNNDRDLAELKPSSSNQTKGLGTPKGVNPNLPPEGAQAFEGLRASCRSEEDRLELNRLANDVVGWAENVLIVKGAYAVDRFGGLVKTLNPELRLEAGRKLKPPEPPKASPRLIAINGGREPCNAEAGA